MSSTSPSHTSTSSSIIYDKNKRKNQPRDPPCSSSFITDPYLEDIHKREQFGVVLIAAWPPPSRRKHTETMSASLDQSLSSSFYIQDFYHDFIKKVKTCFDPIDLLVPDSISDTNDESGKSTNKKLANIYIYPPQYLHITIATFHPVNQPFCKFNTSDDAHDDNDNDDGLKYCRREAYIKACQIITQNAIQRPDWPKQKIHITVDRFQIGQRAGIILFNDDEFGSIQLMRDILKEEYDSFMTKNNHDNSIYYTNKGAGTDCSTSTIPIAIPNKKQLIIPNIIHSTFCRFYNHPQTNGIILQERFQKNVNDYYFQQEKEEEGGARRKICIDSLKLVMETKAYMHIPADDSANILASLDLL